MRVNTYRMIIDISRYEVEFYLQICTVVIKFSG